MKKFKKVVVNLVLVAAMLVGGALSASAAAEEPVVPNAVAEHSHANCGHSMHPVMPMVTSDVVPLRTACPAPGCGAPQNWYPPYSGGTQNAYHQYLNGMHYYPCTVVQTIVVHSFHCVAGHVAQLYYEVVDEVHYGCGA